MAIRLGLNLEFSRHHNMSFRQAIEETARIGYEYEEENFLLIKYSLKINDAEPGKQIIDKTFKAAGKSSQIAVQRYFPPALQRHR